MTYKTPKLTFERLQELLSYEPETGIFRWRNSPTVRIPAGARAGGICGVKGYWYIRIDDELLRANRIAWLYMTGEWPKDQVDHINGIPDDDRWDNLRAATNGQNSWNRPTQKRNTSGTPGVYYIKRKRLWFAMAFKDGKRIFLGSSASKEKCIRLRKEAVKHIHGEFAHPSMLEG